MSVTFNIRELTALAFSDYVGPPFPEWWSQNYNRYELPDLSVINAEQLKGGRYFMTLKLSYKGKIYELPNEPIVSLGLTKTIVKTATVGTKRKGTVKEYVNTEDWVISIKGVCVNPDDLESYPTEQVQVLNELFDINDSLDIVDNKFFELFGIRRLVLEDFKLDEMIGEQGAQRYYFSAISDQDFYADLAERNQFLKS